MRVLNDRDEKTESAPVDFFAVVAHSLLCAIGLTTLVFGPLALLSAYPRMSEPWPKVSALAGAVIALLLFQASPAAVIVIFVFSLFVADSVWQQVPLPKLILTALALAAVLAVGAMAVMAQLQQLSIEAYFSEVINALVTQTEAVRKVFSIDPSSDGAMAKVFFRIEGPFLYLSGMLVALWFGIGTAAHFGWFPKDHIYAPASLRKIKFPVWVGVTFLVMFTTDLILGPRIPLWFDGLVSLFSSLIVIQGTVYLSQLFESRAVSSGRRTVIYSLVLLPGFYLVLLVGAIAPWLRRINKNIEGVQ